MLQQKQQVELEEEVARLRREVVALSGIVRSPNTRQNDQQINRPPFSDIFGPARHD